MEENVTAELDKYQKGGFDVETKQVNFKDNTDDFFSCKRNMKIT